MNIRETEPEQRSNQHEKMEPLESPRVTQVGGILSTGEDTDGERTDDEVDYPTDSFVSQHQEEEGVQCMCVLQSTSVECGSTAEIECEPQ